MVNRTARNAFWATLLLSLAATTGGTLANGYFPFDRELAGAEGPLPGCRQAPTMTVSRQDRHVYFRVCCNRISAPAGVEGETIRITGPAVSTRMHCGAGQAAEDDFLQQIDSQRYLRWRLEGGMLLLESNPPLRFRIPAS